MCEGFGIIATKDGRLLFVEPDNSGDVSHSDIIKRAGLTENKSPLVRNFVRVEFHDWTEQSFRWDEQDTLPGWADDDIKERCVKLLLRVHPIYAEFEKVRDQALAEFVKVRDQAWAEYNKVGDQALAEFVKVRDQAWAEYNKVGDQAWAEFVKVGDQAWAEFVKVRDPAWAEFEKVRDQAWAEFEKMDDQAWAEMKQKMSSITGYCGEK